ncbi:hypothetical protein [Streptomyces fuscigenes]|uniref:hypothetical protein n=1 Tax=Streptomyces fuscigenes TaxID=1528880 RepID=UPI001F3D69CB|nr:hypothetical protein [Streptomyces fuscigenes]MCF3960766.1 hypothetical protein [Streptomyces fuscigenes]
MHEEDEGSAPNAGRVPRWVRPVAVFSVPVLAALLTSAWMFGAFGAGHPFGDDRACAGSDVPLQAALDGAGIRLPPDATDVHFLTHAAPRPGQYALAVAFRSSRAEMEALLTRSGLVHGTLHDMTDGRFVTGDPMDPEGLCGPLPQAPVAEITGQLAPIPGPPGAPARSESGITVDVELGDLRMMREETTVLITSAPGE